MRHRASAKAARKGSSPIKSFDDIWRVVKNARKRESNAHNAARCWRRICKWYFYEQAQCTFSMSLHMKRRHGDASKMQLMYGNRQLLDSSEDMCERYYKRFLYLNSLRRQDFVQRYAMKRTTIHLQHSQSTLQ